MNHLILLAAVIPVLVLIPPYSASAYDDPKHCHGYNACFSIGYSDGYSDAQGFSPAYACVGHSQGWCSGYNEGFRAGNAGSNIYYGPNTGQTAYVGVHGNDNKISITQQTNNQIGDSVGSSLYHKERNSHDNLPNCVILCVNSDIRIR